MSPKTAFSSASTPIKRRSPPDADIVLLATPPGFRPIHYAAAVEAGKNVFMEKPCCVDAPGFRSLMETNKLADEKGLKVAVGLQRRHSTSYVERGQADSRRIVGRPVLCCAPTGTAARIWIPRRKAGQTEMEYQMRNWYHFVWLCGDHICEQHVHNLDVCNWVKGDHPVEANGMGGCQCRDNRGVGQIYDNHFVEFTYRTARSSTANAASSRKRGTADTQFVHGVKGVRELVSAKGRRHAIAAA